MFDKPLSSLFSKLKKWLKNSSLIKINPVNALVFFLKSWWHIVTVTAIAVICLYYPLGGWIINDIDTNTDYEIPLSAPKQSATIATTSYIVNREVNDKLWTPNLPFFFPSYFLDNMPSFQLGMINTAANTVLALSRIMPPLPAGENKPNRLDTAVEMLQYPGTVWLFSLENNLVPAPSSTKQYRRAIRQLDKYNQALSAGIIVFTPRAGDLKTILALTGSNLKRANLDLEKQIREFSSSWFDGKADNVFYFNRGKAYATFLELQAIGRDYKEIIVAAGQYENWTIMLAALQKAAHISPMIIRNGELDSLTAPNHLAYLNGYILKARLLIRKISNQLPQDKD